MRVWLQRRNLRFVSMAVVVVCSALLVVALSTARHGRSIFGSFLGGDYPAFYVAGKILNEFPGDRLYDRALQSRLYHELLPAAAPELSLPFANPPFAALLFRPLAFLPYRASYIVWLLLSLAFFIRGVTWMVRGEDRWTALWVALSFEPFIVECWIGGQLSAIGLCAVGLALDRDRRGQTFAAGLAMGLLLYKPTLLLWIVPALFVGRRWRTLLGMGVTAGLLVMGSWLAAGWNSCVGYAHLLVDYLRMSVATPTVFRVWKFIDLRSFLCQWLTGQAVLIIFAVVVIPVVFLLLQSWMRADRRLLWGAMLTATLVANVYVGIYDAVLVIPSLLLTFDAFGNQPPRILITLAVFTWIVPCFSPGFQFYTLVLAALCIYQLVLLRRFSLESRA